MPIELHGCITICSGKGGVGKTTTVAALSAALAKLDVRVDAQVDADYGASLTRFHGYTPSTPTLEALLDGRISFEHALNETTEGVPLIPTDAGLAHADRAKMPHWRAAFRALAQDRLIVVDTSDDVMSPVVAAAIVAADVLVVPVPLDRMAYQRTFPEIYGLLAGRDPQPEIIAFAAMVDRRLAMSRYMRERIAKDGIELIGEIPRGVAAIEGDGTSVVDAAPRSAVALAYMNLATVVLARLQRLRGGLQRAQGRAPRALPVS